MKTIVRDAIESHLEGNGLIKAVSKVSDVSAPVRPASCNSTNTVISKYDKRNSVDLICVDLEKNF